MRGFGLRGNGKCTYLAVRTAVWPVSRPRKKARDG